MEQVIIGVDPHKLSATIEVIDGAEQLLGAGRFTTDQAGYAAMRGYVKAWPERVWAVEGANGVGRPLAQRLLEAGEHVVDVPAKLGQAQSLLMERHGLDGDRAFEVLRRYSQDHNIKLRDVAAHLIETRQLPTITTTLQLHKEEKTA